MSNTIPSRNCQNWCITDGGGRDAKNGGNGGGGAPAARDARGVRLIETRRKDIYLSAETEAEALFLAGGQHEPERVVGAHLVVSIEEMTEEEWRDLD